MTDNEKPMIDFTMMHVTHAALRRDVGRFASGIADGRAPARAVAAGWANFKRQLHVHHTVEDDDLWPRLYAAVTDPAHVAMLEEMEAEHAVLDPMLEAVDQALAFGHYDALGDRVEALAGALDGHLRHEEHSALPLIQHVLTRKDWEAFSRAMARKQGVKGAAIYIPWIVDGATGDERKRFFAQLPPPVRVVNKLVLEPRYRRMGLWGA
jgi:Hemerythrin HHE cation binding domain